MSDLVQYPDSTPEFEVLCRGLEGVVDTKCRFPDFPFRREASNVDVCQFSHVIEGQFGQVLQALADVHGDSAVSLVVLSPTPRYYRDHYGSYPAFSLASDGLSETYWGAVAFEPRGDATGAVTHTADIVAMAGSSGAWAVWGERSWDVAAVMSNDAGGTWLSCGVPFVPAEVALADFTEPDFKSPLTARQRATFLQNFGGGGRLGID